MLLKGGDIEYLKVAIVGFALPEGVHVFVVKFETVTIGKFGRCTDFVELLNVEVDLIFKELLYVPVGCAKLFDCGINIDPAKNQDSVFGGRTLVTT